MVISENCNVDSIDVAGMTQEEAVRHLMDLPMQSDIELYEIPYKVAIRGVSMREQAYIYKMFLSATHKEVA